LPPRNFLSPQIFGLATPLVGQQLSLAKIITKAWQTEVRVKTNFISIEYLFICLVMQQATAYKTGFINPYANQLLINILNLSLKRKSCTAFKILKAVGCECKGVLPKKRFIFYTNAEVFMEHELGIDL